MVCNCFVPKHIRAMRANNVRLYEKMHNDIIALFNNNYDMINFSNFNRYWNDFMRFEYEFCPTYVKLYGSRNPPQNYMTYFTHLSLVRRYQAGKLFRMSWWDKQSYKFKNLTFESIFEKKQRECNEQIMSSECDEQIMSNKNNVIGYNLN